MSKDPKQSLAVAYNVQRQSKRKKMAKGGDVKISSKKEPRMVEGSIKAKHRSDILDEDMMSQDEMAMDMLEDPIPEPLPEERPSVKEEIKMALGGVVDRIMAKRSGVMDNNQEEPNQYYGLNEGEALDYNPDDDMIGMSQPEDSNEHGQSMDDDHDMSIVDKIRRKSKKHIG